MIIKSNTAGKLNKMINGTVFSSEVIFVKEFLQNAQRAKASMVNIEVTDATIIFTDNGKGCKKPDNLFTLDLSEWESTTEGFGIGFWSCLAIEGLISIKVRSYNWLAEIFIEDLLNNNLNVNMTKDLSIIDGFKVELTVDSLNSEKKVNIEQEVINVAQYLDFLTYYNGSEIRKIDIFSSVHGDYVKEIENRYFKAKLSIYDNRYSSNSSPTLFYDKREVCYLYDIEYARGVIEAKPGKIDLKEPDRTDYIWNSKYREFARKIYREVRQMYIDFLKSNPSKTDIDTYSDAIDHYLDVKDYEKYLDFDELIDFIEDKPKSQNVKVKEDEYTPYVRDLSNYGDEYTKDSSVVSEDNSINLVSVDPGNSNVRAVNESNNILDQDEDVFPNVQTEDISCLNDNTNANDEVICTVDEDIELEQQNVLIEDVKDAFSIGNYSVKNPKKTSSMNTTKNLSSNNSEDVFKSFKKELKGKHKIAWVLKEEISMFEDEISRAEYVGIKVFKLDNILFANVFKKYNKMHISEFSSSFEETFKFKNISLRNAKEVRAIENLIPICKKYNLPLNTFVIGDIEINRSINYRGKTLYKNTTKNKRDNIEVYAVESDGLIILDRTAMNLSRFKLIKDGPFGINDLKYVFSIINTIAHELSHYLHKTKDNTIEHYQTEVRIQEEITKLYI